MRRPRAPHPTSIRLSRELKRRLEKHAEKQGKYLAPYIVYILEREVDRLDRPDQPLPIFTRREAGKPDEQS